MPKVDLSILRLAICELVFIEEIPSKVSINEAIELAKLYCDDKAPKFINGILGSVVNSNGLRQSEGVFQHINNLGELSEKLNSLHDNYNIVGVCVSKKPRPIENSYMPVFTVGYNFGKFMANSLNCKFYETTHQENHIEASLLNSKIANRDRFLSVHMSGGTTEILLLNRNKNSIEYNIEIVGGTKDISFGQLIDRIGVKLGYRFPAGKYIDKNAISCERKILNGLKTSVKDGYMNLSGLENQINKIIDSEDCKYISKLLLDEICISL